MATKRTYQPKKRKRIKKFGFMSRMASVGGRRVLKSRRNKKRHTLSVSDEIRIDKNKRLKRLK